MLYYSNGDSNDDSNDELTTTDDTYSNKRDEEASHKPEMHIVLNTTPLETLTTGYLPQETVTTGTPLQEIDNSTIACKRTQLMDSISQKKIAYRYLDIFTLCDPPSKYHVRETNEDFIDKLAEVMINKKSVSLHNAPNIIGLIDMPKSD